MILLWGILHDGPLAMVHRELCSRRTPVMLFDQERVLDTELELAVGDELRASLRIGARAVNLNELTAVYTRTYDWRRLPALQEARPGGAAWRYAAELNDAMTTWLDLTPARVINRPSAVASNGSKPYQASSIRAAGFLTPDTLITTDPDAVREFAARHRVIVYKSVSGVRSIVSRLTAEKMERLGDIRWCPTQFQQYVNGTDYRVHVIGGDVFCTEINCAADDYRYACRLGASVTMRAAELPVECAARCVELAKCLGLEVAGVDLRRTPGGEWHCFEVNPSPGFTYYQVTTEQPIAAAIASLLANGSGKRRRPRVSTPQALVLQA